MLHRISCPAAQLVLTDHSPPQCPEQAVHQYWSVPRIFAAPVVGLEETDHKCNSLGIITQPVIHRAGNWLWQR